MEHHRSDAHAQVDELAAQIVQLDLQDVQFLLAHRHVAWMDGFVIILPGLLGGVDQGFGQDIGARGPHHRTVADVAQDA